MTKDVYTEEELKRAREWLSDPHAAISVKEGLALLNTLDVYRRALELACVDLLEVSCEATPERLKGAVDDCLLQARAEVCE